MLSRLELLPTELISSIAEVFCLHCSAPRSCQCGKGCLAVGRGLGRGGGPECEPECPPSEIRARICALDSLCRTSRRLWVVATPHLYHRPDADKWWLLARTLLHRSDLAQHVKRINYTGLEIKDEPDDIAPEVWSYYEARRKEAHEAAMLRVKSKYGSLRPDTELEDFDYWNMYERREGHYENFGRSDSLPPLEFDLASCDRHSLLATLCPEIEVLEAAMSLPSACYLSAPLTLPRLVSVELAWEDASVWLFERFGLRQLAKLFRAAPNLRVLRCSAVCDKANDGDLSEAATASALTHVELTRCTIMPHALAYFLRACSRLETLRYHADGGFDPMVGVDQFHPLQARDAILQYGGSLKKVAMDFSACLRWRDPTSLVEPPQDGWYPSRGESEDFFQSFTERGIELELTLYDRGSRRQIRRRNFG
ncbi:hypothetical protein VTG60DRAFT_2564 [Thermothelomyces hinnuleus]